MTPEFLKVFMEVAEAMAKKSKDGSTKVGAVLVKPSMRIASVGFNGFPQRIRDDLDLLTSKDPEKRKKKLKRMVHAEQNALRFCESPDTNGFHMVVTGHPCATCALEIACSGVDHVWYKPNIDLETRWAEEMAEAREIFEEAGIELHRVDFL